MKIQVCRLDVRKDYITINNLTNKQLEYINTIEEYKETYKQVPSLRQICKLMGKDNKVSAAFDMMNRLYKKGYDYRVI